MARIALTGGIGSGKSSVARLLAERGAIVVDADQISRDLVEPGQPALVEIAKLFGNGIVAPDGRLDRSALADIVFADADKLAGLNAILHPRIAQRTAELLAQQSTDAVVVYDMPLLVENNAATGWDVVIVVEASPEVRVQRLLEGRGMSRADAQARMSAQATDQQRREAADIVIDNNGTPAELAELVSRAWSAIAGAEN